MAIVHSFDKRSGITYVYESKSTWNKERKRSESKRTLIGRLDKETGEIIPTDGRMKKKKAEPPKEAEPRTLPNEDYKVLYENALQKIRRLEAELADLKKDTL